MTGDFLTGAAGVETWYPQHWPRLYYQHAVHSRGERQSRAYGWTSTPARKEVGFSQLNQAICAGTFVTYSEPGVDDLAAWIYDEHGRIMCGSHRDETTGAQARHGDRGIAYMLCVEGRQFVYEVMPPESDGSFPIGSYGWRLGHEEVWDQLESGEAADEALSWQIAAEQEK